MGQLTKGIGVVLDGCEGQQEGFWNRGDLLRGNWKILQNIARFYGLHGLRFRLHKETPRFAKAEKCVIHNMMRLQGVAIVSSVSKAKK